MTKIYSFIIFFIIHLFFILCLITLMKSKIKELDLIFFYVFVGFFMLCWRIITVLSNYKEINELKNMFVDNNCVPKSNEQSKIQISYEYFNK